jgi:hypothetical protein
MVRRMACVAAMALALLRCGQVHAGTETLTVSIEYSAPPSCPDIVDFKTIVSNRLGYDAFLPDATDHVLVEVATINRGLEGHIEWRTPEGKWAGERRFPSRSDDCHELIRAMGFALALQIQFSAATGTRPGAAVAAEPLETTEPKAETPAAPPAPPPAPPKPEEPKQPPPALPEQPESPDRPVPVTYALGAGGALGFGMSSKATPLGRIFANLAWKSLVGEIAGEMSWPINTWREDRENGAGFGQQVILASLAGCGVSEKASACLLAKGGLIRIAGQKIDDPATPSGSIFQAGLRLGWTQPIVWRVFIAAQAAGLINLTHWRVMLDTYQVWSSPRLAGTIGLDIGVSLP